MSNHKYKVGDKVWIREDLIEGQLYGGTYYKINFNDIDIRGKEVEITACIWQTDYNCDGYSNFNEKTIDEEKTNNNTPNYEIY